MRRFGVEIMALLLALLLMPGVSWAAMQMPLHIHEAWVRPAPEVAPVRAAYAVLENHSPQTLVLDQVRSAAFGAIEIHEMHEVDGVLQMRPRAQLEIAPGQRMELKPGGLHLMLFRPQGALEAGTTIEIEFWGEGQLLGHGRFLLRAAD